MRHLSTAVVLLALTACASALPAIDWRAVAMLERNREGETGLALPTELPGCTHLGMARVSVPEGAIGAPYSGPPPELIDQLKQQTARKGGNTLVVLPGVPVLGNSLRGSVFQCPSS